MAKNPAAPPGGGRRRYHPFPWSRWVKASGWFGGIALVLVLVPVWIGGGDSDYSCGSILFKGRASMNCEFSGTYRHLLVAIYVAVGLSLLSGAIALARMEVGRHRQIGVRALPVALVVVVALGFVGWAANDARPPTLRVTPEAVDAAGEHTFVVTGSRFYGDPSVEIVRCTGAPSVRPCSVGVGADVEPVDGGFEVSITVEVPPEGISFQPYDDEGHPIVGGERITVTSLQRE